ncbi:hypothetical protein N0V88_007714 [Collariella sp. IMI 366227]|nr:hypothetical protein N0V88_007714 [Collariella sp. IMI 366227]
MATSWVDIPPTSDFSLANLPFGIISTTTDPPHPAVAIGAHSLLSATTPHPALLRDNAALRAQALLPLSAVTQMHLPMEIGDYTDFYAGYHHAWAVGVMFRGEANALQPNYLHLPVGYHGRASSVLELGCFIARGNEMGTGIGVEEAEECVFGYVLLNDWSARDVQTWEYVPLGPFNGKNFASTVTAEGDTTTIGRTSARHLIWSFPQMIAHHTLGGCPLRTGDLLGSGTISGPGGLDERGSLLEMTENGKKEILLSGMDSRTFLKDGDTITLRGSCGPDGARVGFAAAGGPLHPSSHRSSLSAPGDNSAPLHHRPQSPLESTLPTAAHAAAASSNIHAKRRADDPDDGPAAKQQRSKRNRRRKIKCNGQTPCQRCGHLNLQCLYAPNCCSNFKDSDEFRHMSDQVRQLQDHVDTLYGSVNALRQETARLAPLHDRVLPPPSTGATPSSTTSSGRPRPSLPFRVPSSFNGPTSLAYTVDVAKSTLYNMGYSGSNDGPDEGGAHHSDSTPHASPGLPPTDPLFQNANDPLWEYNEAQMMGLLQVFRDEINAMYPVASMGPVSEHAKFVAAWMATTHRTGYTGSPSQQQLLADPKTLQLKIIMCCSLVVNEHGNSPRAVRLYDSIQPVVDKMLMSEPVDVTRLPFLAMCAGYRWLSNDEVLAWRMIGQVSRLCFELGLHRREGLENIADPQMRRDALHTFWSAYVLDRRWSFSTGLPFVCHDDKIDPKLPYPEGYPFLVAMIGYSRLAAKIWRLVDYFEPAVIHELKPHDFDELDREIMTWYETVPEEIRTGLLDGDTMAMPSGHDFDLQRLRLWTRLRLNQVRIWLYTPVLHSATSISENAPLARKVVDLAKHTIRLLARLNRETDLYRRIQVFYHQFLTSAIAVLFLASTHAPLQFSPLCKDEFYMALDLVKEMSAKSFVSRRLWRTIRSLRAYAPKLGLGEYGAVGMSGIVGEGDAVFNGAQDATVYQHMKGMF